MRTDIAARVAWERNLPDSIKPALESAIRQARAIDLAQLAQIDDVLAHAQEHPERGVRDYSLALMDIFEHGEQTRIPVEEVGAWAG